MQNSIISRLLLLAPYTVFGIIAAVIGVVQEMYLFVGYGHDHGRRPEPGKKMVEHYHAIKELTKYFKSKHIPRHKAEHLFDSLKLIEDRLKEIDLGQDDFEHSDLEYIISLCKQRHKVFDSIEAEEPSEGDVKSERTDIVVSSVVEK